MANDQFELFGDLPIKQKLSQHFDPDDGYQPVSVKRATPQNYNSGRKLQVVNKRAEVMRKLHTELPLNDLGLPVYIYRADMIPEDFFDADFGDDSDRMNLLNVSSIQLDYLNGTPSLPNGTPLWAQLPYEGPQEFHLFLRYLGTVMLNQDTGDIVAPVRTLENVAVESGQTTEYLRELSFTYYWEFRIKAHDLFMAASYQKQRETRAIFVENSHFAKTVKWIRVFEEQLEKLMADEDLMYDMEPKKLFDMFMEMIKLQRISVGLPANGAQTEDRGPKNASMDVLIRSVAQKAGEQQRQTADDSRMVENLLNDPESLEQIQEMIIRTSKKGK